jgi:hypothetical protein
MDDGIYVPLSERTLRKLDQLERWFAASGEGYSEDRIIGMALDNMLACIRQGENDNFPDTDFSAALPPDAYPSNERPQQEASEPLGAI